jgi:orotate phosphoribosyltransferase
MDMTDVELARALREHALLEGDFTLRSGRKSRYYLDKYLFETQPVLLREIARRIARFVTADVDRLAGPELGGVALAAAVALETGKPFVIVRNARKAGYGTGKLIEGPLEPGQRVLLIEDVATSGGQALEAARTLSEHQAQVVHVVAVLDRQEGARQAIEQAGYRFSALLTMPDIVPACSDA